MGGMIDAVARNRCVRCDGRGRLTAHSVPCSRCGGSGEEPKREGGNGR